MANPPIGEWTILAENHDTGSDHEVIELKVDRDTREEADHKWVVGWNLMAMKEEDEEAPKMLWMQLAKESAHLDLVWTEDVVEQETAWCEQTLSKVLDITAKKIRIYAMSKRGWNGDIQASRKTQGQEKRRCGRHSDGTTRAIP